MKKIEIYDPALCCSSGVCGTSPDQELVEFAAVFSTLQKSGACIERFNLSQQPAAFAQNSVIKKLLEEEGVDMLPVTLIDGKIAFRGVYPTLSQLSKLADIKEDASCCSGESDESCCGEEENEDGCCGSDQSSGSSCCS